MQSFREIAGSFVPTGMSAPSFLSKALAAALLLSPLSTSETLAGAPVASGKQIEAPNFIETVQRRVVAGRGVAVGPRGGAVARRGYVARGPGGGVVAGGGYVARGPRGNVVAGRGAVVAGPGYRPVPVQPWARPASYWWHPGMAVVSGAAIGFVTATAATAYANSRAPAPGYCWYYTNPQRTQGFWDVCP
ncbi:conserved hypothetical protein [Hyphomicrobiales bacterium]|nr:conserved hypothetical protein [Hyphomicrobiales bacterium]CAH1700984.1 conserved hypothetical protein [Hyphomicrobiales bacterium]CAI0344862.1 conserved hypothetical protein [Hyphomicrobiales bacterium]